MKYLPSTFILNICLDQYVSKVTGYGLEIRGLTPGSSCLLCFLCHCVHTYSGRYPKSNGFKRTERETDNSEVYDE